MARQKGLKRKKQIQSSFIINIALIPFLILIRLGDGVRAGFRLLFSLFALTYNTITFVTNELRYGAVSWLKEKTARQRKKKHLKPRRTKRLLWRRIQTWFPSLKPIHLPSLARITLPKRRISWPSLPKILLPGLHLPSIRIPSWTVPSVRVPHISLPKVSFPIPTQIPSVHLPTVSEQLKSFAVGVAATILFIFIPYTAYQWLKTLPSPQLLAHRDLEVTTKIFDRNGALLYEMYADQNRTPIPLAQIPVFVKNATVAIEDQDFYRHQGFSIRGILRATRETLLHNQVQGGSTITQQLIKSALLTSEVKLSRKIKEVLLAFWAERLYSKNQILEMYLNQVPYGGTAWGIEAASQTYFGKSVKDVTLAEAALLAGLPAAPTQYSPFGSHPEKAFERQAEVIRRMVEDRYITREEAQQALSQEVKLIPPRIAIRAAHFVMYVKNLLENRYGARLVERGGLRVITSLDVGVQERAEDIVKTQVQALASLRVGNGAALVTNPKTGEILAMVGSKDYFDLQSDGNVNVTTSLRQPGSSIKVVNYAAALENGFTAASPIDDSPIIYQTPGSPPYAPVNYDEKFHGLTPLRYALANSYNIPAVKVLAKLGVKTMIDKGRLMGINSWEDESRFGLSLTLGGGEVTMTDMAEVFGTLANAGRRADLLPILEVTDYTGRVIERNRPKKGFQAVKPEVAWILGNILSDNAARAAAFGSNSSLVIPGKTVSVKTGTSNDKRDNWTIGYTPSYVVVVWVGNNNNAPMDPYLTSGITGASPIWHDIMADLLKDKPDELAPKPDDVVAIPCHFGRAEYFVRGTEPAGGRCAPLPTPTPTPTPTP